MQNKSGKVQPRIKRFVGNILKIILSLIIVGIVLFLGLFIWSKTLDITLDEVHPDEKATLVTEDPANRRSEGRTYFSYPEWYIVYSAQEYSEFLKNGGRPSDFPNVGSIEQFWQTVDGVKKATSGKYTINNETNTVINTIGYSFAFEYTLSAIYESTIGKATELLNFNQKSPEDIYNEHVTYEYGQFLNQIPWYEFPYFEKLKGLWTDAWGINSFWVRGVERKIILSINYGAKGTYGALIKKITRSSFEVADVTTTFTVKNISENDLVSIPDVTLMSKNADGSLTATSTRYRAFTTITNVVLKKGGEYVTIENNDDILLSAIASKDSISCIKSSNHVVFIMPILTQSPLQRFIISSGVKDLGTATRKRSCLQW